MSEVNFKFQCIAVTAMRPDMVLYSECERIVYFIELMIPFEDVIEKAFERKKLLYAELEARERGWQAHTRPGVRGFVVKSTTMLLLDFSFRGRSLKRALTELLKLLKK